MFKKKGNIIIISGASGTGKTSLIKELIKLEDKISLSISYASRKKRKNENNGEHYFFISEKEFENHINNDFFLEYAKVHDNYYGTSKEEVFSKINAGLDVILEIDVQGANIIKHKYSCMTIFIIPPNLNELKKRLSNRGTEEKSIIDLRLNNALLEIQQSLNFDYIVINDNFDKAVNDLYHIICSERLKVQNNRFIVENILK